MICIIASVAVGYERKIGFGLSLLLCVALTPVIGFGISLLFAHLPKACCMKDYRDFSTGRTYYFRKKERNGHNWYYVQHASAQKLSAIEFNKYFAEVVDNPDYLERQQGFSKVGN
ncbi:MAG: hypothetical protein M0D57_02150 [Sphingobacteriales bacterium JAD_PAG50586_3]|nr:MAG: hypothetical protein M0D57_02150 [Sphingobacteriales bacterium JAD_PAG50586_3]